MKANRGNVASFAFSLLVSLLVAEAAFRFLVPPVGDPPNLKVPDQVHGFRMASNFSSYYVGGEYPYIKHVTNSRGYRDEDHVVEKPDGVIRILGLGDSVTVGSGTRYNETFLRVLETSLNEKHPGKYEVIKMAVGGWELEDMDLAYRQEGAQYKPDIVVYGLCLNDILNPDRQQVMRYNFGSSLTDPLTYLRWVQRNCYLCNFAWSAVRYSPIFHDRKQHDLLYRDRIFSLWRNQGRNFTDVRLKRFIDDIRKTGAEPVVVVFPFGNQFTNDAFLLPQEMLHDFGEKYNVTVIDVRQSFVREGDPEGLYLEGDLTHFKSRGHRLVSAAIEKEIT